MKFRKPVSNHPDWNKRLDQFLDSRGACGKINSNQITLVGDQPRNGATMTEEINQNNQLQHFVQPEASLEMAKHRYQSMLQFVKEILKEGVDYGIIPGAGNKPTLLKPGGEKLATFFGLSANFEIIEKVVDWKGETTGDGIPFFYFHYRCTLTKGGVFLGNSEGSANSLEVKHAYRWIPAEQLPFGIDRDELEVRESTRSEFAFAIEKAETSGQYGKPQAYWDEWRRAIDNGIARPIVRKARSGKDLDAWEMGSKLYRIKNRETADLLNTIQKMGQKRSFIATVLITTNASEFFTQDIEDMDFGVIIDSPSVTTVTEVKPEKPAPQPVARPPWEDDPFEEIVYTEVEDDPRDLERAQKRASAPKATPTPPADDGSAIGLLSTAVYDRAMKLDWAANEKQAGLCGMIVRDFWPDKEIRERLVQKVVGLPSITKADGQTKRVLAWLNWFERDKHDDGSITFGKGVVELMETVYEEALAS